MERPAASTGVPSPCFVATRRLDLITLAPRSPRVMAASGPARTRLKSATMTPESALAGCMVTHGPDRDSHPRHRSAAAPPALSIRGLTKRYADGTLALEDLDLEIPDGSFFDCSGRMEPARRR